MRCVEHTDILLNLCPLPLIVCVTLAMCSGLLPPVFVTSDIRWERRPGYDEASITVGNLPTQSYLLLQQQHLCPLAKVQGWKRSKSPVCPMEFTLFDAHTITHEYNYVVNPLTACVPHNGSRLAYLVYYNLLPQQRVQNTGSRVVMWGLLRNKLPPSCWQGWLILRNPLFL